MSPLTVPRTLTDFDLISPLIDACSPIVRAPVESIAPSTSPSISSSLANLTVPLIETPRESNPPDAVEADDAPFDRSGAGGGV
jgi:hypothetical protein